MNYELTIRQSFAKLRRILGSNFAGERKGSCKHEHGGEGGLLIGEDGSPKGWPAKETLSSSSWSSSLW
jgi:hypothetical protein